MLGSHYARRSGSRRLLVVVCILDGTTVHRKFLVGPALPPVNVIVVSGFERLAPLGRHCLGIGSDSPGAAEDRERVLEHLGAAAAGAHRAPGMTLRARSARKRRGDSPRRTEEGTVKVCPEAGRERRLMDRHLGAPAGAAVQGERRAPTAGSKAFIKDAGRRF